MMLRTKVLVIGGGPAGSTAARFLAKEGIDTILIERNLSFVKPCGGGVSSTAFDELDIPKKTIKKEVNKIRFVSPRGEALDIELKGGFLAMVDRGEFDSVLRHEAGRVGAELVEGEFKRFVDAGASVIAEISIDGENYNIKADYVVAADGVNSRVRAALGIRPVPSVYTISERIKGETLDLCEFWFGASHAPRFYSWVFPKAEGISAGTGCLEPGGLKSLWQRFIERRGLRPEGSIRGYRVPLWKDDLCNKGNILFAGDAAGHVMPLTYEGIYYAMKAGELAARTIIEGRPADYRKLWRKRFHKRFLLMKRLGDYFLRDDDSAERLVAIYKRYEVQEASMRLWLRKDSGKEGLISYINFFRKFLS